ncbi:MULTISPECIES: hypothetical protein [unclassified Nocardioides]|uniref:hypothetical protein n=1 Tax=unclassified Nocardioides TaxID=2615069 RepID=UPI003619863E
MASDSTSAQPAGGSVKWVLAAGFVLLIVLFGAVAVGVLNTGSGNNPTSGTAPPPSTTSQGTGEPTPGDEPSATPTVEPSATPTAEPSVGDFVGVWVGEAGAVVTVTAGQSFEATRDGELVDSGAVVQSGSSLLLLSDTGPDGEMRLTSVDTAVVALPSVAPNTQFIRG